MQKNFLRVLFYCIGGILLSINVSAQQNMVRKWIAQKPIVKEIDMIAATATVQDVLQVSEYVDGFGRPMQSVSEKASPLQKDGVSMHVYDATGREVKMYMPFISNIAVAGDVADDGNFKTNAAQQQTAFNQGVYTGESFFYSQADFENSPLNRVTKAYAQGNSWTGASRGTTVKSVVNTTGAGGDNVRIWDVLAAIGSLPTSSAVYTAGQLYKSIATDENGLQVIEYKDKDGHVVLKKSQNTAPIDAGTGSGHAGWLCTYYVYDDYGNMRFIITPRVVELIDGSWAITQALADELCYRNEYDDFGRKVISKSPGAGEEWFVYDKRGRIVMSQDANMRQASQKQWKYYQYENSLDRLKSTGLLTDPTNYNNRVFHRDAAFAAIQVATSLSAYPALGSYTIEQLTQTYYDEYLSWVTGTGLSATADLSKASNTLYFYAASNVTFPYPQVVTTQSVMTRGMVTGSKTEVLKSGGANYLYTISYYDDKGRIIQTQGTNISGTGVVDIASTQYSWNGTPLRILEEHAKTGTNPQTHRVLTKMNYDFAGRLQNTTKTITSLIINSATTITNPEKTIATYTYDEMSRVKTKTLGTKPNPNYLTGPALETLNYDYNVRGWLTGINKAYTQYASTANYFGMELGYDKAVPSNTTTSFVPVFNGNISGMIWKSKSDGVPRKYDYNYDKLNQLTKANFLQSSGGSTWDKTSVDYSVNSIQYDLNGNIKKLNQNGFVLGGASNIDDLTYNYGTAINANSNKLMNVLDIAPNNAQSKLGDYHYAAAKTSTTVDYGYDPNGNLISDMNKNITLPISYNALNLPWVITTPKGTITYTYDAAGNKLKKTTIENNVSITLNGVTTTNNTITTITTYIGGFIYQSKNFSPNTAVNTAYGYTEILQCMLHEEGRARIVTPQSGTPNFAFDYFIKDHLGNVRMVLTDEVQQDKYPVASLEPTKIANEKLYYDIKDAQVVDKAVATGITNYVNDNGIGNNPIDAAFSATNSTKLYQLNSNTAKTGLGITLKVMAGDKIDVFGKSYYFQNNPGSSFNNNLPIIDLLTAFLGAPAAAVTTSGHGVVTPALINTAINTAGITTMMTNQTTQNSGAPLKPKAFINVIFFDEQFKSYDYRVSMVGNNSAVKDHYSELQNIMANKGGYVYIYCSNESPVNVYFDNLQVVQTRSPLIEEKHFYPGGLAMQGISSRAYGKLANAYGYQGKEMQAGEYYDGTGLEEYDFEARYYDPQLMRWHNQDPAGQFASPYLAMGNNWPNGTDPDGRAFVIDDILIGVAIGAIMGGISSGANSAMNGQGFWSGAWKGALVGGIGGAIGSGLSSLGAFSSWGMVGGGIANGAIGGAVTGGLSAGINGGNVLQGAFKGALWGGVIGGAMGALQRLSIQPKDVPMNQGGTTSGEYFESDQELYDYINKNVGDLNNIQSSTNSTIALGTENNLPDGYTIFNHSIYNPNGDLIGGTTYSHGGWLSSYRSEIFMSPDIKGTFFGSGSYATMAINHEFMHAYHWKNLSNYSKYSERATSTYSLAYSKAYGMLDYAHLYRQTFGNAIYPQSYSWHNFVNLLKLGIK